MGKITLLNELNTIGEKLGYPFYLFEDGSYGKSIVNGKMNAIAVIKKPFKQTELHEVQRIVFSAPTSSQSNARKTVDGIQQTYEERVAALSEDERKKLQKAILLVRSGEYGSDEEGGILLRYAQRDDVERWLRIKKTLSFKTLSYKEYRGLFENSLLSTDYLKQCIEDRESEIARHLSVKFDCPSFLLKSTPDTERYVAYLYVQSIRPSMLLWFMNKFYRDRGIGVGAKELSFIRRCVQLNDFSMLTEYVRKHPFRDFDYLVDEVAGNPELYKWFTEVYLPMTQKSA